MAGKSTTATLPEVTDASATEKWSQIITAADVEDEIKAQQHKLAESVRNATQFKAGQFKQARVQLSMLAAMLAIVAEYDGSIRWKRDAAALRDVLGRAGFNCKVASDASHAEALARSVDLQSLIRGESVDLPPPQDAVDWPRIADRPSLMKRLEQAQQQGILPSVASPREFEQNAERLLHDAQVIAALSEAITRTGYEFADDETYVQLARAMRNQALALRDAVRQNNYEQVRQSAGQLGQSCTNCHEGFRS